jgi:MYXO-CTERM domain-containing protein
MTRPLLSLLTLAAFAASVTSSAHAETPDLFGRTGYYDLTGSPLLRGLRLDQEAIRSPARSHAEGRGLAGAPEVEVRRNYVYVQDNDRTFNVPYRSQQDLFRSFEFALREVYRALPDEFAFVYLFTSFDTRVGAYFYSPESNDIRGIGQQLYDQNGSSPRQGFIFMNYWRSFEQIFGPAGARVVRAQSRSVFNQEAGHRWGSFLQAGEGGNDNLLLGRDDSHWSYFLHSGGSPMEGNAWRDNGNGTFTTATSFNNWRFSDLDLYAMGLLGPADVEPFFGIADPVVGNARDIFGQALNAASPPQIFEPQTVRGRRIDFTIDDVVQRNGRRSPSVDDAPKRWRVVFVMLAAGSNGLDEADRVEFEDLVDGYALGFKEGTRNLGELDYVLVEAPRIPIGGECGADGDCDPAEASLCLITALDAPGLCTRPCDDASGCPTDWCCEQVGPAPSPVCLPANLCPGPMQPDAGISTDAACACDVSSGCDEGCACDAACQPAPPLCACDETTACDERCDCDPECGGCGCTSTPAEQNGSALPLALAASLIGAGALARRRRR